MNFLQLILSQTLSKIHIIKKFYDFLDKQQIEPEEPSTTHDEVKIEQPPVSQSKTETEQVPKKSDVSFYKYINKISIRLQ